MHSTLKTSKNFAHEFSINKHKENLVILQSIGIIRSDKSKVTRVTAYAPADIIHPEF